MTVTISTRCDSCGRNKETEARPLNSYGWYKLQSENQTRDFCSIACVLKWCQDFKSVKPVDNSMGGRISDADSKLFRV